MPRGRPKEFRGRGKLRRWQRAKRVIGDRGSLGDLFLGCRPGGARGLRDQCPSELFRVRGPKNKNEAIDCEPYGSQTIASIQNPSSTAKRGAFAITFSRCGAEAQVR